MTRSLIQRLRAGRAGLARIQGIQNTINQTNRRAGSTNRSRQSDT